MLIILIYNLFSKIHFSYIMHVLYFDRRLFRSYIFHHIQIFSFFRLYSQFLWKQTNLLKVFLHHIFHFYMGFSHNLPLYHLLQNNGRELSDPFPWLFSFPFPPQDCNHIMQEYLFHPFFQALPLIPKEILT